MIGRDLMRLVVDVHSSVVEVVEEIHRDQFVHYLSYRIVEIILEFLHRYSNQMQVFE